MMSTVEERIEEAIILRRTEGLLHRFHATRPLSEEPKSPQAVFFLQVSLRGEAADNFHGILTTLSECAVWRIVNVRGASAEIAACETNRVVPQELVLRLQLSNTGNFCYMNALVLAVLWVATHPVCTQSSLHS